MANDYELQVIQNQLAIQEILDNSVTIEELDALPSEVQAGDYIAIRRLGVDTFYIPFENFVNLVGINIWSPLIMGFVPTLGQTSTFSEIQNHINSIGFNVAPNNYKILQIVVKKNNLFYRRRYLFLSNEPGSYGDNGVDGPVSLNSFYSIGDELINENNTESFEIALGDIGSNSIVDYINNNDSLEWDLQSNTIYLFSATVDGFEKKYYYIGPLPKYLGQTPNQPDVVESDFFDLSSNNSGWHWIEGSNVEKGANNFNLELLEEGDIVWFKDVQYNGSEITLRGWKYEGGNKLDKNSYTKAKSIA